MKRFFQAGIALFLVGMWCNVVGAIPGPPSVPLTINHQGVVKVGDRPFTGNGNFRFALIDPVSGLNAWTNDGTGVGSDAMPVAAVVIACDEGVWTVGLGGDGMTAIESDVFSNDGVTLRVWFDDGTHPTEQLSPDILLVHSPYAVHAIVADSAGSVLNDSVSTAQIADGTIEDKDLKDGAALAEILDDDGSGSTLDADKIDGLDSTNFWNIMGNSGTYDYIHFLGTTDDTALIIKVDNERAARFEPTGGTPNIIEGSSENLVVTSEGAAIGGGGAPSSPNTVDGDFGTIAGGKNNTAGENGAIGGGGSNITQQTFGTIGGGEKNQVNVAYGTIGGGTLNITNGQGAAIAGGAENVAASYHGVIGGGQSNEVNAQFGTIGGGQNNSSTGQFTTISGGQDNIIANDGSAIGGGVENEIHARYSAIAGGGPSPSGNANTITDNYSFIGGGADNIAGDSMDPLESAQYSTVGGGLSNRAGGWGTTVAGGYGNTATAISASVGGGESNDATGAHTTIAGGLNNTASTAYAFVGGGSANNASGSHAMIGGGSANLAQGASAVVGGGSANQAAETYSTVAGGGLNMANGQKSTVGGGMSNSALAEYAGVAAGHANYVNQYAAFIGGGESNYAYSEYATVSGGDANHATGTASAIGGGSQNETNAEYATVAGGLLNLASGDYATVSGGSNNRAEWLLATIAGGSANEASAEGAVVSGGNANLAEAGYTVISGGKGNRANQGYGTVGGGTSNTASGSFATVGGGTYNTASGQSAVVSGGASNVATGINATVSGGSTNSATNNYATVPGGANNTASGTYAFAAGRNANALHSGSFVWADSNTSTAFNSDRIDQIKLRASNGMLLQATGSGLNPAAMKISASGGAAVGLHVEQTSTDCTVVITNKGTGDMIKAYGASDASNLRFKVTQSGDVYADGAFNGGGADFAEYMPRADAAEILEPGDLIGVFDNGVSRKTDGARRVQVVTTKPCVLGGQPEEGQENRYIAAAFIGRVPVKVTGPVNAGDFIIPSGKGDGCGIARPASEIRTDEVAYVAGQAIDASSEPGVKKVMMLVGAAQESLLQAALQQRDHEIASLRSELEALKAAVNELAAK